MFKPKFMITLSMVNNLLKIERASVTVEQLPLPASILDDLKREAKETTVLLSTKLEGNTLSEEEKRKVLYRNSANEEEQEIYNLMKAIEFLDDSERRELPITEEWIKKLHAVIKVTHGRRARISEYREEQNKVGDRNQSGFYLPPEPQDVPVLMEDLVAWLNSPQNIGLAAPIRAGIAMWQFLTIHPYMDGNGRTARMIATYLLRRNGYGLKGLFVLENFYDRNLNEYYRKLQMELHHNYYFGRHDAMLTPWLDYFLDGLGEVYEEAAQIVKRKNSELLKVEPELIRRLEVEQRALFRHLVFKQQFVTNTEIGRMLGVGERAVRDKVKRWIAAGFIEPRDPEAQRIRTVVLSLAYEQLAEEIRQAPGSYPYLMIDNES
ncbi:Fic family protein [Saccharibacillus qingshengii]|uniref:Fic family protein n=1 Tax=Saccharibacillus qingshengii TaxID=1763540 RepID=UPI0015562618|nr:Fic family protein [Saccharibacillus qingshengii]